MSEHLTYKILLIMFLEEQLCNIEENIIDQDNQITIRMENNGRNLCTGYS